MCADAVFEIYLTGVGVCVCVYIYIGVFLYQSDKEDEFFYSVYLLKCFFFVDKKGLYILDDNTQLYIDPVFGNMFELIS